MNKKMRLTETAAAAIAELVTRRPWLVLMASILFVIAAASGAARLELVNNYRIFFSDQNPDLVTFNRFQETYTKNDNLLFVVQPASGEVFTKKTMAAVERLTEGAWRIPFAIRVDSISNFQHSWAHRNEFGEDELVVEDLVLGADGLSDEFLAERRAVALAEPLLRDNLISPSADATGVNITLQYPEVSLTEVPEVMEAAHALADEITSAYPDLKIAITGVSALNAAFSDSTMTDGAKLFPIMFLILIGVSALVLRSTGATIATLGVIIFSTATAMGVAGFVGWPVSPISGAAPVIILTLAIADSIHILMSMLGLMRTGVDKVTALKESLKLNFLAISITSVTTLVGFLALNFSDAPPFHHLGNMTAVGIAAAWLFSLTLLPALVVLLPIKVKARQGGGRAASRTPMVALADFVIRRYRSVLAGVGITAVALIALVPTLELNDEWVKYFDERLEFRQDAEFALDTLTGLYLLEYSVSADEPGGINEPEYLQTLEAYTGWLKSQPEVRHVYSYADIVKRLNKNMHGDDEAWYAIPEDRNLAAQYLLLYELSLPYGLDLNDRISVDKLATRVTVTLDDVPTATVREFINRSADWMAANAPPHMRSEATGATVMFSYISERNINSMLGGNAIAIVLIALIMIFALRSLPLGTLSLIPNAVPILMAFGVWALLVGQVGMSSAMVSAASLGIVVDNTVHYLTKYLYARRENGLSASRAVTYAFETVGTAILANAVILAAGFAVLAFSTFRITADMGLLTAIAIVIAVAVDFLLLPALLLIGHKSQKGEQNVQISSIPQTV